MSTVYAIQNQHALDRSTGLLKPKFDLSPAEEFGDIKFLLGPNAAPWNPEIVIPELRANLVDFNDSDHLLLIGNPVLIGWATTIAADINEGVVSLLQWSGRDRRYISVQANLFD